VEPFNFTPSQISLVMLALSGSMTFFTLVGGMLAARIGPVLTQWIAFIPLLAGSMFIGNPSTFLPTLLDTVWPADVAVALMGCGVGLMIPGGIAIFTLAIDDAGYGLEASAVPLSQITTLMPMVSNIIGPLIMGNVVQQLTLPTAGVCLVALLFSSLFVTLVAHSRLTGRQPPEKAAAKNTGTDIDQKLRNAAAGLGLTSNTTGQDQESTRCFTQCFTALHMQLAKELPAPTSRQRSPALGGGNTLDE
jgi:MFS family permease